MVGKKTIITFILLICFLILFSQSGMVNAMEAKTTNQNAPTFNKEIATMSGIIILFLIIFIWEPLPIGIISLFIPVTLVVLNVWTRVSVEEALSGFSNSATITIMAMFVISRGIQNSGAMQILGNKILEFTGNNEKKQVITISGITGGVAGFINNTPTVAAFVPMVTGLARKTKISPSKLLMPLSYAAMLGGTLTLLGTSTNLLGSQVSARLINHPFSMFEFTKLGIVVLIVGVLYLITVGHRLLPERISHEIKDYMQEYEMDKFLTEISIEKNSSLIGQNIGQILKKSNEEVDIIQLTRNGQKFMEPLSVKTIRAGDHLVVRANQETLLEFVKTKGLKLFPEIEVSQQQLENESQGEEIIEAVIPDNSFLKGKTINEVNFLERYDTSLLAIRHGEKITHEEIENFTLRSGDVLLLLVTESTLERLIDNKNFIIEKADTKQTVNFNILEILFSIGIALTIIILASLNILPIVIATLAGVIAMVILDLVEAQEVYDSINWEVIFLLAGLIPFGVAIEHTGTARFMAHQVLKYTDFLSPIVILGLFYFLTTLITNIISNNASVVLMIPVAVNAAHQIGANPFAFVLAVTFAASNAFATPIGYQTNLMVYGPGGYKFRDFIMVGAPLQMIMSVVVPIAISFFWGI